MKYSSKATPPASFVVWKASGTPDWQPTYKNFQKPERDDVWNALLAEQEFVCGYCGRRLKDDRSDSHIDHFRPQEHYNANTGDDLTLDYDNFVASCGPPGRNGRPSTCGDAKGSKFDEAAHIAPWETDCEQRFSYGSSGEIAPTEGTDLAAKTMIENLKLDDRSLVEDRRKIVEALEFSITENEITEASVPEEIARWHTADNGRRKAFSQVATRYLEAEFGLS
jgi:uncharacterized protein (TIGR02646 family)